jgi:hypothetical protein
LEDRIHGDEINPEQREELEALRDRVNTLLTNTSR